MSLAVGAENAKAAFWQKIFSILGPFDLYGTSARDPLLRGRRELVVQICRLIDYPENLEVSVAALHAIADISETPVFAAANAHSPHKLFSILESAGELSNVMESFIRRLEREETEQVSLFSERGLKDYDGSGGGSEEDSFIAAFGLANLVRLQILDFFIVNMKKSGYNLAHYLLGFGIDLLKGPASPSSINAPDKDGSNYNCFHIILELLAYGLGQPSTPILALDHPSLGRKCYELLNVLLSNRFTASAVVNYLRGHEDCYRKQLVHFSPTPVDLTDVGYTIFEFHQRAALFTGASLDLQLSFMEGSWSYARKLVHVLVKGALLEETKTSVEMNAGSSLVLQHLTSVEAVLCDQFIGELSPPVHEALLQSVAPFIRACFKLVELVLVGLDRIPYDRQVMTSLQHQLLTSIIPFVCKLQANPHASTTMLEACASLSVAIAGYFQREVSSSILAGDEMVQLTKSILQGILRPDASVFSRGYWYSAFCDCFTLATTDPNALASIKAIIACDGSRILEVAASDSVIPSAEADGWKTMATTFLELLLSEFEGLLFERLLRVGFLKTLTISIRSDDRSLAKTIDPSTARNEPLNCLFLWKARMSLLETIAMCPNGAERLLETGICDCIAGFKIMQMQPAPRDFDVAIRKRRDMVLLPLLRLIAVLSSGPSTNVKSSIRAIVSSRAEIFSSSMSISSDAVSSDDERLELAALALFIVADIAQSRDIFNIFTTPMAAAFSTINEYLAAASNEGKDYSLQLAIVRSATQFFHSAMSLDPQYVCTNFSSDPTAEKRDSVVPISSMVKLLDFAAHALHDNVAFPTLWTMVDQLLLLLCSSLNRCYTVLDDRDLRQASAFISPSLEQLLGVSRKDPTRNEPIDQYLSYLKARLTAPIK